MNPTDARSGPPAGWPKSREWEGSGWLSVAEARATTGLRVTDSPYWGAWWAQALRGVLYVKGIPYQKVVHPPFSDTDPDAQSELRAWTGQTSVPTMVYNDGSALGDIVRNDWLNQLMLAEQIAPEPSLIPGTPELRMKMIGLAHELMSPQGFLWNCRLAGREVSFEGEMSDRQRDVFGGDQLLGGKYSFNGKPGTPLQNAKECLGLLGAQLDENTARFGGPYLVGDTLSALDVYWAYASNSVRILPPDQLPVMRFNRAMYPAMNEALAPACSDRLLEHRDAMFATHLECPVVVD